MPKISKTTSIYIVFDVTLETHSAVLYKGATEVWNKMQSRYYAKVTDKSRGRLMRTLNAMLDNNTAKLAYYLAADSGIAMLVELT